MGAPNPFQKLKHGVLLCKKNFRTFVETFNFLVDFSQCLRGDGDGMDDGLISVDRSIPDRPVIRSKLGYGAVKTAIEASQKNAGRFELKKNLSSSNYEFLNPYYNVGGRTFTANTTSITSLPYAGIIALKIDIRGASPTTTISTYTGEGALQTMQDDQLNKDYYVIPLYSFSDGNISCDWRHGPDAAMGEFLQ